ncbi:MAG: osmoprotectant transport system substrate-binding protein, partial [bacterium]
MRTTRVLALGMTLLVLVGACSTGGGASPSTAPSVAAPRTASSTAPSEPASAAAKAPIRIGSDNFYESKLMGEIYAQVLENAGYTVERKFALGSRQQRIPIMDAGQIDLVPEYVGSGLGFYDKTKISGDGAANAAALQAAISSKGLTVLGISPGQDTNAFVVRAETSTSKNLTKMSDLAAVQNDL